MSSSHLQLLSPNCVPCMPHAFEPFLVLSPSLLLSSYFPVPSLFFPLTSGWDRTGGWAGHRVQTMSPTQYKLWGWDKERSHNFSRSEYLDSSPACCEAMCSRWDKGVHPGKGPHDGLETRTALMGHSCPALGDNPASPCAREIGSREPTWGWGQTAQHLSPDPF